MKTALLLLALIAGGLALSIPAAAQTPTERQLQSIETLMAPQRKKVLDVLQADKTGQYQTYQADLAALAKEKDAARRLEGVARLERDHLEFIRKAYAAAGIDNAVLRREVARILGHNNFAFGEFAGIEIDFIPPLQDLPLRFDATLSCPFAATDETDNSAVAARCVAQAYGCYMRVDAIAEVAGGCRSKADVGGEVVLPAGNFTRITVAAKSDISYDGWAFAVAGYAQVNAKFGLRFRAPGLDKTVMAKEVTALAPLIWLNHVSGDINDFTATASFSGSFPGGTTVKAQVHTEVFALSVPLFTLTMIDGNATKIHSIQVNASN
jgi:hypothetical protein